MKSSELASKVTAFQRSLVMDALFRSGGNVSKTARELSVNRNNLYKRLANLNIDLPAIRAQIARANATPSDNTQPATP